MPRNPTFSLVPALLLLAGPVWQSAGIAQIPSSPASGGANYKIDGMTDQPFSVEVLDTHRTVGNTLLVRMAITDRGTSPLRIQHEFADAETPSEAGKISGVYAVDPNGEIKYTVLRNAQGRAICSKIDPPIQPGERRNVFTQLQAPPDTSSAVSIYFPSAGRIEHVPIGLPASGEAIPPEASIGDPGAVSHPAPAQPLTNSGERTTSISPNVVTDQVPDSPSNSPRTAAGEIQDGNSVVPFSVEAIDLKRQPDGRTKLELALTNNSSGPLDADGQFTRNLIDPAHAAEISGLYIVDPVSHAHFEILRPTEDTPLCSSISPALAPGERRILEAQFPDLPAAVKTVYVYFPHAAPIADVSVTQ